MSIKLEISAIIFGYNIRIIINPVTNYHESCSKYLYIYAFLEFISKKNPHAIRQFIPTANGVR